MQVGRFIDRSTRDGAWSVGPMWVSITRVGDSKAGALDFLVVQSVSPDSSKFYHQYAVVYGCRWHLIIALR